MKTEICVKESFAVIGKQGTTADGPGFVQQLWAEANAHFGEVAHLAKREENGNLVGLWGAMSDCSGSFAPWEDDFSKGLYLAGVECRDDAQPPEGWTKWIVPGFAYIRVACDTPGGFRDTLAFLEKEGLTLAGAIQDFTNPATGKNEMFFPVRKL